MKKKLILGMILGLGLSSVAMADQYKEVRLGFDALGTYNSHNHVTTYKDKTKGVGFDLAGEYMASVNENLYLGAGVAYQVNQKRRLDNSRLFRSVPVYGAAKYMFGYIGDSAWQTFAKANLGYSFNFKENKHQHTPKDGLYWAVGGGIENQGFVIDLSYQDTYSEINHTNYNYSRWTLGLGYRFY